MKSELIEAFKLLVTKNRNVLMCQNCWNRQFETLRYDVQDFCICGNCGRKAYDIGYYNESEGYLRFKRGSLKIITPLNLKNRKIIHLVNVYKETFKEIINDNKDTLQYLILTDCINIKSYEILQTCPNLKGVWIENSPDTQSFWDFTKTPLLEGLVLIRFNPTIFLEAFNLMTQLKFLVFSSIHTLPNLNWVTHFTEIEELIIDCVIGDEDLSPVLELKKLKYFWVNDNFLPLEVLAYFEAKFKYLKMHWYGGIYNKVSTVGQQSKKIEEFNEGELNNYLKHYKELVKSFSQQKNNDNVNDLFKMLRDSNIEEQILNIIIKSFEDTIWVLKTCTMKKFAKKRVKILLEEIEGLNILDNSSKKKIINYLFTYIPLQWHKEFYETIEKIGSGWLDHIIELI